MEPVVSNVGLRYFDAPLGTGYKGFTGSLVNGKREGFGIRWYRNGAYKGTWHNGLRSGRGYRQYFNGNSYDGGWLAGKRHGFGIQQYKNGWYKGTWHYGKREKGVRHYCETKTYFGY
jgi:hypothetical protein